jgi:hypothetical protein
MTPDPLAVLMPVLADTMKFATQALAEASAIADVLIEKGILTKAELDAKMSQGQKLRDSLMRKLDEEALKQS